MVFKVQWCRPGVNIAFERSHCQEWFQKNRLKCFTGKSFRHGANLIIDVNGSNPEQVSLSGIKFEFPCQTPTGLHHHSSTTLAFVVILMDNFA
ncbi:hypothetical protein BLD44_015040 [Mastigocladus laminosus UU774]|nr:hypothetical protein BLD44_015040 [Mastigocladus laminosus UU774]